MVGAVNAQGQAAFRGEKLGLAVPAMNRVFSRVRALGVDIAPAVYTVEQAKAAFLEAYRRKEGV